MVSIILNVLLILYTMSVLFLYFSFVDEFFLTRWEEKIAVLLVSMCWPLLLVYTAVRKTYDILRGIE